ncbi:type IX secretion system ring subunit PorN/GldN [Filimonas effusa]|uniref:Gliding motility protein GldN n=1 Tax=Filimonas effusa TaxID=2508721 RepID=A0A4Q1D3Q3_9BACT|nr:gliding motility protein GldN [Filimonas effusa]RXK81777.1 gliding motility protein GldN [Filimonas effusa]
MKRSISKIVYPLTILAVLAVVSQDAAAQRRNSRSRYGSSSAKDTTAQKPPAPAPSGYGTPAPSGYGAPATPARSGYGNAPAATAPANDPAVNVPIEVVPNSGGSGIGDTIRPSLRNDNSIERNLVKDRTPLTYEYIREDDAVYRHKVWRIIDAREKINLPFRYSANEDNGNQRFISILYNSITGPDSVTAFSAEDDRFTTPLTKAEVLARLSGSAGADTVDVTDLNGNVVKREVRNKQIPIDSIYQFKIKEEWIFDKESSRMFVRILGIAPMMRLRTSSGIDLGDDITLFWIYYPDLRAALSKYEVYNGKNYGGRMTWEELFENRQFSSRIVKSTLDNPFDKDIKGFITDPLFQLLEGENIKEKIFNYEQSLWAY